MKNYVIVDGRGAVLRGVSCPSSNVGGAVGDGESHYEVEYPYNGGLAYVVNGLLIYASPPPSDAHTFNWVSKSWDLSLLSARAVAWSRIKGARDAAEFGVFTWSGHTFDGDESAQRRLAMAEQAAQRAVAAGLSPTIDWTLADNTAVTLSAQDVIAAFAAMTDNIRAAHDKARALRAQIEAATTVEQLEAITWD